MPCDGAITLSHIAGTIDQFPSYASGYTPGIISCTIPACIVPGHGVTGDMTYTNTTDGTGVTDFLSNGFYDAYGHSIVNGHNWPDSPARTVNVVFGFSFDSASMISFIEANEGNTLSLQWDPGIDSDDAGLQHFFHDPNFYFYTYGDQSVPPSGGGGTDPTGNNKDSNGLSLLSTRTSYLRASSNNTGIVIDRSDRSNLIFDTTLTIDTDMTCRAPRLSVTPGIELISCLYRRLWDTGTTDGSGNEIFEPRIYRKFSMDDGFTWFPHPVNMDTSQKELLQNVRHAREIVNRRTRERLILYNDNSGMSGAGLIQADIYNIAGTYVNTFPTGGGGVGAVMAADGSFDALQIDTGALRITFSDGTDYRTFQSEDDGRTWFEVITS